MIIGYRIIDNFRHRTAYKNWSDAAEWEGGLGMNDNLLQNDE